MSLKLKITIFENKNLEELGHRRNLYMASFRFHNFIDESVVHSLMKINKLHMFRFDCHFIKIKHRSRSVMKIFKYSNVRHDA